MTIMEFRKNILCILLSPAHPAVASSLSPTCRGSSREHYDVKTIVVGLDTYWIASTAVPDIHIQLVSVGGPELFERSVEVCTSILWFDFPPLLENSLVMKNVRFGYYWVRKYYSECMWEGSGWELQLCHCHCMHEWKLNEWRRPNLVSA